MDLMKIAVAEPTRNDKGEVIGYENLAIFMHPEEFKVCFEDRDAKKTRVVTRERHLLSDTPPEEIRAEFCRAHSHVGHSIPEVVSFRPAPEGF